LAIFEPLKAFFRSALPIRHPTPSAWLTTSGNSVPRRYRCPQRATAGWEKPRHFGGAFLFGIRVRRQRGGTPHDKNAKRDSVPQLPANSGCGRLGRTFGSTRWGRATACRSF